VSVDLDDRRKALEEKFFKDLEAKQIEELRAKKAKESTKEALRKASGMSDEQVLDRLVELGISADTVSAMSLVPLIQVAWADGEVHENERNAIVHFAEGKGIEKDSAAHLLLTKWLDKRPGADLLDAWVSYIHALDEHLTAEQRKILKRQVIDKARTIAESAGGFLGFNKISREEEEMLARLESAFDHGPTDG
jgi:uncharacterized tellurite resistance protein B-like protein